MIPLMIPRYFVASPLIFYTANDKIVIARQIRAIWKYFSRLFCFLYFTRLRLVKYYGNKKDSKNISHIALYTVR